MSKRPTFAKNIKSSNFGHVLKSWKSRPFQTISTHWILNQTTTCVRQIEDQRLKQKCDSMSRTFERHKVAHLRVFCKNTFYAPFTYYVERINNSPYRKIGLIILCLHSKIDIHPSYIHVFILKKRGARLMWRWQYISYLCHVTVGLYSPREMRS
jgi:hypothetical protein